MLGFVIRRLLVSIPIIALSSFIVFGLVAATGDPLAELRANPNIDRQTLELRARELNLDKPIPERYAIWLKAAVRGDFGETIGGQPVRSEIARGFGVTLRMVLLAVGVAVVLAVVVGVTAAVRQYSALDYGSTFFAFVFFSMPVFFLAGVLKDLAIRFNQAIGRRIFFTIGEKTPGLDGNFFEVAGDRIGHLALPTLTLALISMAGWSRFQRSSMLDVLNSDYVRTARAKGLSERVVVFKHALRNGLIPLTTVVALGFAGLVGGAIITETVFAWNGLGRVFLTALNRNDVNTVTAWLLLAATTVIVFNLLADVLYAVLDPRIRNG